jgi:hypothetical protein
VSARSILSVPSLSNCQACSKCDSLVNIGIPPRPRSVAGPGASHGCRQTTSTGVLSPS